MAKITIKINVGNYESVDLETSDHEDFILCVAELIDILDILLRFPAKTHEELLKRSAFMFHRDLYFEILTKHSSKSDTQLQVDKLLDIHKKQKT